MKWDLRNLASFLDAIQFSCQVLTLKNFENEGSQTNVTSANCFNTNRKKILNARYPSVPHPSNLFRKLASGFCYISCYAKARLYGLSVISYVTVRRIKRCWDSNRGQLGEKSKCFLSATPIHYPYSCFRPLDEKYLRSSIQRNQTRANWSGSAH